ERDRGRKTDTEEVAILQRLQGQPPPRRARAGPHGRLGRPALAAATKQLPNGFEIEHSIPPDGEKNHGSTGAWANGSREAEAPAASAGLEHARGSPGAATSRGPRRGPISSGRFARTLGGET